MDFDQSEILFNELNCAIVNIYKTCFEEMGYDLYTTNNYVEYHNYLLNNPLKFTVYSPGGGDGEWVWVADGTGEDIKGKKIGVLGDSLTQAYEAEISACIKERGGIPVCQGSKSKPSTALYKQGCTLIGGAFFNSFATYGTNWDALNGCDHVITELATNDIGGASFSTSTLTSGMSKVAAKLKGCKVHSVGIMPFAFSKLEGNGMSFGGVAKYAKEHGDEETAKVIHEAQKKACASLGWHFIDPHQFSCYKKWHEVSENSRAKGSDGIHIPASVGYNTWWKDILANAFGGGHWEYRGGSGIFTGTGGSIPGTFTSKTKMLAALGFSSERPSKSEVDAKIVRINVPGWNKPIECHQALAAEVTRIYQKLNQLGVKFEYTYCYAYRNVATRGGGHGTKLSIHAFGAAIDINPKLNPWVAKGTKPPGDDDTARGQVRTANSPIVQAFASEGWGWGASYGDFMHFSKLNGQ